MDAADAMCIELEGWEREATDDDRLGQPWAATGWSEGGECC